MPCSLFLLKFNFLSLGIWPITFMRIAGLIRVEEVDRRFDDRFKSSKYFSSFKSSGNVTKLLPCKSRDFSLGS